MNFNINFVKITLFIFFLISLTTQATAQIGELIPLNTATHTAVQNGSWFDANTWDVGNVPDDAAIVVIPNGTSVDYQGCSNAHIFAIRVDGIFICTPISTSQSSCLTFDTFIGNHMSVVQFLANNSNDGNIEIIISPFDIEGHKAGNSGFPQTWNEDAKNHFSDDAPVEKVVREVIGDDRYNSYQEAINGDTEVVEISRTAYVDGVGVTGRYGWDSQQHSLGLVTMGEIEIFGKEKMTMSKLSTNANQGQKMVELENVPTGWAVGDKILITRGGNINSINNNDAEDVAIISSISNSTITCESNLIFSHQGRPADNLHCYVGNLSRNITFKSVVPNHIHRRGHFMAMHNNTNIQIRNAAFIDMGRTDKSSLLDDFIWKNWLEPKVFNSKISALGQEICQMQANTPEEVTNARGRYSIHLHKTGARYTDNMVYVTGNVVWGNPGWGITHHDSYATVSDNVVYDVVGSGIVSESGSELGFWDNNLVVDIQVGHDMSFYEAALFHDDYLFSGQGLGMKGRGVICRNNVIAGANQGVGVHNLNPSITNHDRVDPVALATFRPSFEFDQFPLNQNGYSIEGNGVMPVEVALIMENTTVIDALRGIRSIERDMGVNHESRSVFDGFKAWGTKQGFSITYQADYSFKDVFISGDGSNNSIGIYIWKHSHNQTFENIKLVDLDAAIYASKLVENNGQKKTRNNGFTPWVFVDLIMENINRVYRIEKEDTSTSTNYSEHGDNTIHLSSDDLTSRPVTFTIVDDSSLEVDVAALDFKFEVDGVITDDFGSYDMGIKQALAQGTLRLDYPERIYEFASKEKFEEYLMANGVFKNPNTDDLYFIINEFLPNRRTFEYTFFPIRIKIKNAPSTGIYANPQTEDVSNFEAQNRLVSRFAIASQSSTQANLSYESESIDASAWKAIDGNVNGRINCQLFQQGLLPVGSFSQTKIETEPWYDLDLKENTEINYIDIWNTVELNGSDLEIPSNHFKDFYVLISDSPFGNSDLAAARAMASHEYYVPNNDPANRKASFNDLQINGRYVRIQAVGTSIMKLAEVEIIGKNNNTTVGLEELDVSEIKVYPNPSTGNFNIELSDEIRAESITIFDLSGRLVFEKDVEQNSVIQINLNVPSGMYWLILLGKDNQRLVKKLVVGK